MPRGGLALLLAAFVALPLGLLAARAGAFERLAGEADAALGTLLLVAGVVGFTLVAGVPLGLLLARVRLPAALVGLVTLPYAVPPYVGTLAWIRMGNPTTGWFAPHVDVYGLGGMVLVLGLHLTPLVALLVQDAARRIDPATEEAARLAGASPLMVLRGVTLPLLRPAVVAGAGFVASAAAASFGVPYLLSAPASRPFPVLTTRIYQLLDVGDPNDRSLAVSLALVLLGVGVGLPALLRLALGRGRYHSRRAEVAPQARSGWATAAVVGWIAFSGGLPLGVVVLTSLQLDLGAGLAPENLGLAAWRAVLGDPRVTDALVRSVGLAAGAATLACGVGVGLGHAVERGGRPVDRVLAAVARAPYAIPGTAFALGLLLAYSQEVRLIVLERVRFVLALADTAWLLLIAYTARFLALPLDGARSATLALDPALEEAARIGGAGPARVWRGVTLPLLLPAVLTGWFLVFVPALCEVTLSVLLHGPRTPVLGTVLFYLQSYKDPQSAAVLAVLVGAVVGLGFAVRAVGRPRWA